MDIDKNSSLPFRDVLVNRRPDGTLGRTVNRKPTHTVLYLDAISEHHPAPKRAVLSTLINRARTIFDSGSLEYVEHPKKTFRKNCCSKMETKRAFHPKNKHKTPETKSTIIAIIQKMRTISGKISTLLAKYIKTIHRPVKKRTIC
jgi:hypothetical protein